MSDRPWSNLDDPFPIPEGKRPCPECHQPVYIPGAVHMMPCSLAPTTEEYMRGYRDGIEAAAKAAADHHLPSKTWRESIADSIRALAPAATTEEP